MAGRRDRSESPDRGRQASPTATRGCSPGVGMRFGDRRGETELPLPRVARERDATRRAPGFRIGRQCGPAGGADFERVLIHGRGPPCRRYPSFPNWRDSSATHRCATVRHPTGGVSARRCSAAVARGRAARCSLAPVRPPTYTLFAAVTESEGPHAHRQSGHRTARARVAGQADRRREAAACSPATRTSTAT